MRRQRKPRPVCQNLSDFQGKPLVEKPAPNTTEEQKRAARSLQNRAKRSERTLARWLTEHDGPDPKQYNRLTTSTGRIGHITNIQADALSLHYLGENKNERLTVKLAGYWQKINQVAANWGKDAMLCWHPSNADDFRVNGKPLPKMHIITEDRHRELLEKERIHHEFYDAGSDYRQFTRGKPIPRRG